MIPLPSQRPPDLVEAFALNGAEVFPVLGQAKDLTDVRAETQLAPGAILNFSVEFMGP